MLGIHENTSFLAPIFKARRITVYFAAFLALSVFIALWILSTSDSRLRSGLAAQKFVVYEDTTNSFDQNMAALAARSEGLLTSSFATRRSENNFWILLPNGPTRSEAVVFASRHLTSLSCFSDQSSAGTSQSAPLDLQPRKTRVGYVLDWSNTQSTALICRAKFVGPARVSVEFASTETLNSYESRLSKSSGILFGCLLMLSAFSAIVSAIARERTFLLFSIWLLLSLRVAAVSLGWDFTDLGFSISLDAQLRQITLGAFAITSGALFFSIFRTELDSLRIVWRARLANTLSLLIILTSFSLTNQEFLPVLWSLTGLLLAIYISIILQICAKKFSATVVWYSLGWSVFIIGIIGEVIRAVSDQRVDLPGVNQVTGSIISALLTGVALAQKLNFERNRRLEAQGNAAYALQRFRENYNAMPVGLFSMHLDGAIIEYNPAFGVMFGLPPPSLYARDRSWGEFAGTACQSQLLGAVVEGRITDNVFSIGPESGPQRWMHMRALRKNDRVDAWIEDITIRKNAETSLRFLADHDALTSLLNRRGLTEKLEVALRDASSRSICIAYIDLDRFKLVNDLFGHVAGDQILSDVAVRMRDVLQPPHVAARIGGDEFVIIVDGLGISEAKVLCERVLGALSDATYQFQDKVFSISASIGVVQLVPAMSVRDALTAADRACAESKSAGGSSVVAFDSNSSVLAECLDEIKLIANIRERLPVENFFTQMQPIVSLRNPYAHLCYEVLVRMRDADGSIVVPSRFIGAAERNGLMGQIDRWVLRSTLEWLDSNPVHRDSMGFCTVNLSGASLNDERFLQDTLSLIREHRHAANKVCFEITETVALYDLNTTRRFVDKVKSLGARIALDDFGKGYTSFNYLKELPGDLLKIDGGFIRDINSNSANYAITRAVVELAHEIGMACVAEWAENADIIRSLIELEVDYAQGFGLSRPVDPQRLLMANDAVSLIKDPKVLELLGPQRVLTRLRDRVGSSDHQILTV